MQCDDHDGELLIKTRASKPLAALLGAHGLRYAYRGIQAVHDVSITVGEGEIVALLGANGAGKSTTVKMIAGALRPAAGAVSWAGKNVTGFPSYAMVQEGVTLVPEGRLVFQHMTVEENLQVGGHVRRARAEFAVNFERVLEVFPRLAERRRQNAGSLSGGEQQMVAIARGMMSSPRLMILDEPSLGLSPLLVQHMFELIRRLNQQGISILLVEQNAQQSLRIADRAYVLEKGRVVLAGTGQEMLVNPFVKQAFLGL
ncbi:ABC transporter ATP-binding protein [Microvirga brassicacearum]|uniref:ABC transporter ATP-binding protein n=1 Tax=Microvirga brassicacearum TaxID=2580413 RepID=A0A5N3P6L8_9HYPH|nr:ABC transporter ATP-binding protein [Microvirga brassicacearum]KAB0265311.1 ABC transporter ATP-binding protein [Microvirga brassicacearum]